MAPMRLYTSRFTLGGQLDNFTSNSGTCELRHPVKRPRDRPHRPPPPVWRRTRPHLPAPSVARYKDALVPRRFSNNSLASFGSLPLSHLPAPPPSCLRPRRAPPTPLPGPWSPQNRYDAASGKNVAARRPTLIRSTPRQHCLVDHLTPASTPDNDTDEAPGVPAGRVAGDMIMRRPQIQDSSPSSFVHQSITPPVSTVVDQGRVSTLTGCVTTTSSCLADTSCGAVAFPHSLPFPYFDTTISPITKMPQ
jgi:hypothetical protein